jgi:hypothetical protein
MKHQIDIDIPDLPAGYADLKPDLVEFTTSGDASEKLQRALAESAEMRAVVDVVFAGMVQQLRSPTQERPTLEAAAKQFFEVASTTSSEERLPQIRAAAVGVSSAVLDDVKRI